MMSDYWRTPPSIWSIISREYGTVFDPCPANPTFDGLTIPWHAVNYVNPPYSAIETWLRKALHELDVHGHRSIFLLPVRTSAPYFHTLILRRAKRIRFLRKRVRFINPKDGSLGDNAPFDCYLVEFAQGARKNVKSADQ